jgi:hypothetical protein
MNFKWKQTIHTAGEHEGRGRGTHLCLGTRLAEDEDKRGRGRRRRGIPSGDGVEPELSGAVGRDGRSTRLGWRRWGGEGDGQGRREREDESGEAEVRRREQWQRPNPGVAAQQSLEVPVCLLLCVFLALWKRDFFKSVRECPGRCSELAVAICRKYCKTIWPNLENDPAQKGKLPEAP